MDPEVDGSAASAHTAVDRRGLRRAAALIGKRRIGIVLLTLLVWITHFAPPNEVVQPQHDSSWSRALGVALHSGMQFGPQLAFTFGPLGYMISNSYDPDLYWIRVLAWEIGFGLLAAALLACALLRIGGALERALAFLLLVVVTSNSFSYALIVLAAAAVLLLDRAGRRAGWIAVLTLVLAALALVKFTLCTASLGCLTAIVAARWLEGERRIALGVGAAWCGWFLLLWTLCAQSPAGLPAYFVRSVRIASGHEEGLASGTSTPLVVIGIFALAILAALLFVLVVSRRPRVPRMAAGLCLWISAFVAFKSGFVRAVDHTPFFFAWVAVAGFLLPTPEELPSCRRTAAAFARIGLAASSVVATASSFGPMSATAGRIAECGRRLDSNVRTIADLRGFRRAREAELRENERRYALPRTRAAVGDEPIDMITEEQGYLFLNGLRWTPRPVFQSYCALDPELLALNARFLESAAAPKYLLFELGTIDNRLPTMDDGLALQAIARDWRPVLLEKGLLLLHRVPRDESADPPRVVLEKRVGFGEEVELPHDGAACHVLSLDIRYSLLGRVVKTLYRTPEIRLRVRKDDGRATEVRIVPGMMRTGAIIDPWLPDQKRWIDWSAGRPVSRTVAIAVLEPRHAWMYAAPIDLWITARNAIPPAPATDLWETAPAFWPQPASIDAALPCAREELDGEEVLVAHAPSDIRFELLPGDHFVRGRYGMMPRSWTVERTDGAAFHVLLEEDGVRRLLMDRRLDPCSRPADRESQAFELRFRTKRPAQLHFVATPGSGGDDTGDWTYWGAVEIPGAAGG